MNSTITKIRQIVTCTNSTVIHLTKQHEEIVKIQKNNVIKAVEKLAEFDKSAKQTLKTYGKYTTKRIIKENIFDLYPEKTLGGITKMYETMLPQTYEKLKSFCNDSDPYATIGCYRSLYGEKKTTRFFNTLLFEKSCETSIEHMQNTIIHHDDVMKIYSENEFSKFEEILEYHPNNIVYLVNACLHGSHELSAKIGSYLKLATIGDSVLDELLCHHFHGRGLTNVQFELCRRTILKNEHLGFLSVKHGFDKFRLMKNGVLIPKKSNADVFEGAFGAVYLDSGRNMEIVRKVFDKFFKPSIKEFLKSLNLK